MGQELREGALQVLWKGGLLFPATIFLREKKRCSHVYVYSCVNHRMMELEVEVRGDFQDSGPYASALT